MAGLEAGQRKWERKTANAGSKWKGRVSAEKTAAGLRAIGVTPGPSYMAALSAGLSATSADDFQKSISGKGTKWRENFVSGVSQ
jgi:hypothetical protein